MGEISDYYNTIDTAAEEAEKRGHARGLREGVEKGLEEGLLKGREKGREEGREEGKRIASERLARNLLARGMDPEEVAELTSLPIDLIRSL